MTRNFTNKVIKFIGSKWFFYSVVFVFVLSALWIAMSARYPMAFDENYHYGIIQQYAKQWSPFFNNPPPNSEALGDITRYPSYLFHYLLSFIYRATALFTDSDYLKIMVLRAFNIVFLASALFIFKKIFEIANLSKTLCNVSLFVFIMIPIVPFLGAQISYDNASIPLTALTVLFLIKLINSMRSGKPDIALLVYFFVLGAISSLIKYTYLPIFVACLVYLLLAVLYYRRKHQQSILSLCKEQLRMLSQYKKVFLALLLLFATVLFSERYIYNVVVYKTPAPDCGQILSVESCKQYGPWGRDFVLKSRRQYEVPHWKISDYNKIWLKTTMEELFFAIDHNYTSKPPLPVLFWFIWFALKIGLVATILMSWKIMKNRHLRLFTFLSLTYVVAIWADNFMKFYNVHWPVAIHGRYLLPLLPLMIVVLAYGVKYILDYLPKGSRQLKLTVALITLMLMTYGGGVSTFILASDKQWYWSDQKTVTDFNTQTRQLLRKFIKD